MSSDFIVFGQPLIERDEIDEVVATLESRWLGTGPRVREFEAAFADYRGLDANQVAAVNSGTAALHLALLASGVTAGDEVIVPAMTFCASVNAIIHAGATPVLADVDPVTMNLDPADVERRITPRTRAILPVHFAGLACDMDRIMALAGAHGLKVVEDCAHAIETTWRGRPVGTFGDFGCFSFYVTKNLTTGEGGMVVARSPEDAERLKVLALHGMSKDAWHRFGDAGYKHYEVVGAGFKYNMMDLQAALGIHQLRRLDKNHVVRRELWHSYAKSLASLPLQLPTDSSADSRHAYHLFPVLVDPQRTDVSRDELLDRLTASGVGVGVHYLSIAEHAFYRERFGMDPESVPVSTSIGQRTLSLPLSAALDKTQQERVVRAMSAALG